MNGDCQYILRSGRIASRVKVASPVLRNYFVLAFPHEPSVAESEELLGLGIRIGQELSTLVVGHADSFTVIHSGHSARRAAGWHLHIVVIRNRAEKAWFYFVLAGKNLLQAIRLRRDSVFKLGIQRGDPASGRPAG